MKTSFGILHSKWVIQYSFRCMLQETGLYENSFIASDKTEMTNWINAGNTMPDILYIGSDLEDMSGPDTAKEIRKKYSGITLIGICRPNKLNDNNFMIDAGCQGVVCSNDLIPYILNTTKDVFQHHFMTDKPDAYIDAHNYLHNARELLNDEDLRIVGQLCTKKSPTELARDEHVSKRKFERKEGDLYKLLQVKNRVELVIKAKDEAIVL